MQGSEAKKERTRQAIQNALIELCGEKPYLSTTIGDICRKADVNRSTFYRYYDTKDELLRDVEDGYIRDLQTLCPTIFSIPLDSSKDTAARYQSELEKALTYHLAHRKLSSFLLSSTGDPYFAHRIENILQETLVCDVKQKGLPANTRQLYAINYFLHGYFATIVKWVREQNMSVEEVSSFVLSMALTLRL